MSDPMGNLTGDRMPDPAATRRSRVAINPLPWLLDQHTGFHFTRGALDTALRALGPLGYRAVSVAPLEDASTAEYLQLLAARDFAPAPGYFGADFTANADTAAVIEAARQLAEFHVTLGLDTIFIAADLTDPRLAHPAVGFDADADRLDRIAAGLVLAAEIFSAAGVTAALHPHVSSFIETEAEIRHVLDATAGSTLAFGPDLGHLLWAGADVASLVGDYAGRVAALHLKDARLAGAASARAAAADYADSTTQHRVWTEPGRGDLDVTAVFAALGDSFDGWSIIEVDVPDLPTPEQSSAAALDFVLAQPYFGGTR
ncbi:sugar phosphate isomerase/epimerase family protein [Subtercola sp. YIM 133946]|uniref:sugar phosphate isomerase/epimerase family protein n=1 Tax=Subtercola sp. YIM 133946 TaxID=3118909 RepID=UPI002F95F0D2